MDGIRTLQLRGQGRTFRAHRRDRCVGFRVGCECNVPFIKIIRNFVFTLTYIPAQELISRNIPYNGIDSVLEMMVVVERGWTLSKPQNTFRLSFFDALWRMCLACWKRNPKERPTAANLRQFLSQNLTTEIGTYGVQTVAKIKW